jgi:hypothetical protein
MLKDCDCLAHKLHSFGYARLVPVDDQVPPDLVSARRLLRETRGAGDTFSSLFRLLHLVRKHAGQRRSLETLQLMLGHAELDHVDP